MAYAETEQENLERDADSKRAALKSKVMELKSSVRPSSLPGVPEAGDVARAAGDVARKGGEVARENGLGLAALAAGAAFFAVKATSKPSPRRPANVAAGETTSRDRHHAQSLTNRIRRQPLAAAAIAVAGGALLGAMLPRTQAEDELVGPYRDRMRDDAMDKMREKRDQVASAAREGLETAKADLQEK